MDGLCRPPREPGPWRVVRPACAAGLASDGSVTRRRGARGRARHGRAGRGTGGKGRLCGVDDALDRARQFLDRRTTAAFLATTGRERQPEIMPVLAPRLTPEGLLAVGEEAQVGGSAFRHLRVEPRATLLLLDPVSDPRSRDGVRLLLEFEGAEVDGPELAHLCEWLAAFAPGRRVVRRLLFRVRGVQPYRAEAASAGTLPGAAPGTGTGAPGRA